MRFPARQAPPHQPRDHQQFIEHFRQKYGREMTPAEMHFCQLAKYVLEPEKEQDKGGTAGGLPPIFHRVKAHPDFFS
jgi:hypothetical protein